MTFEWAHRKLTNIHDSLRIFDKQLANINPNATLCYQSQYSKFTISLYDRSTITNELSVIVIDRSHISIRLANFPLTPAIDKLIYDLNEFVQKN